MSHDRSLLFVTLSTLTLACGAGEPSGATDGGDAGLSSEQTAAFETSGGSLAVNLEMAKLADSLFSFDPTIDPKRTPEQNAAAIAGNARSSFGKSCAKIRLSGADVTVSFGAPPGCTLANGDLVSGNVGVALSHAGSTTTVALTLTQVVYDGVPLDGTASFATSDGSTFTLKTSLDSSGKTDSAELMLTGATGSFSLSGTTSVTKGTSMTTLTFNGLTVALGKCYATAGSIGLTQGSVSETLTFDASTPATGKVTVAIGKLMTTETLPPYGSCPSG